MQITTRTRYALRMLVDIAVHPGEKVKVKDVASRQDISKKYLEQLTVVLSREGFVRGERGPNGGYVLGRDPSEITAGMVARAMECDDAIAPCVGGGGCARGDSCATHELWARVDEAMLEVLDSTTVESLAERHMEFSRPRVRLEEPRRDAPGRAPEDSPREHGGARVPDRHGLEVPGR